MEKASHEPTGPPFDQHILYHASIGEKLDTAFKFSVRSGRKWIAPLALNMIRHSKIEYWSSLFHVQRLVKALPPNLTTIAQPPKLLVQLNALRRPKKLHQVQPFHYNVLFIFHRQNAVCSCLMNITHYSNKN